MNRASAGSKLEEKTPNGRVLTAVDGDHFERETRHHKPFRGHW